MTRRNRADDRERATEPKFYLPAGVTPLFDSSRVERIWRTLFKHQIEPPK